MSLIAIILTSENSLPLAKTIQQELTGSVIYTKAEIAGCTTITSIGEATKELFPQSKALVFIGALGICVRSIASCVNDKYTDPAVVNIDSTGRFAIAVLSGHIGGANDLARQLAGITGGEAVVTTQSDLDNLWPLDTTGDRFGWTTATTADNLNVPIATFVNKKPVALLLDIRDQGTLWLEKNKPAHVDIYYTYQEIDTSRYELLIAVTPYLYPQATLPVVYYHPKVLHLGVGCRKACDPSGIASFIAAQLAANGIARESLASIATIDIKQEEPLLKELENAFRLPVARIYTAGQLQDIAIPNPSAKVEEVTSVAGVSEPAAIRSAQGGPLILEKQKRSDQ